MTEQKFDVVPVDDSDFADIRGTHHIIEQPEMTVEYNVTPGKEGATIRFDHSKMLAKLERGTDGVPPRPFVSKDRSKE